MKRVVVLGICGSGKSTFARRLQQKLSLPLFHLDQIFWRAGWNSISREELKTRVLEIASTDEWIIEGVYFSSIHERLARADTVVLLEMSRYRALWRIVRRVVRYLGATRPDMSEGCPERIDWEFVRYVWSFPGKQGVEVEEALRQYSHFKMVRLKGDRATKKWLDQL